MKIAQKLLKVRQSCSVIFWGTPRVVSLVGFFLVFLLNRQSLKTANGRVRWHDVGLSLCAIIKMLLIWLLQIFFVQRDCEWKPELWLHENYQAPRFKC